MGRQDEKKDVNATGLQLGIVAARYNPEICDGLLVGAIQELEKLGLPRDELLIYRVPGVFEIPWLAKLIVQQRDLDGLICLGAVIRGETSHFDYVCQGVTFGLQQAILETEVPMGFGILTTDNETQARERASLDDANKGRETARTVVEMVNLKKNLK